MGIQELYPDLPDVVVGLGGAGKNVVRTLLEQEWVVESIVAAAAEGGQPECYFVDADTEQLQDDDLIAAELNDRIQEAIHFNDGDVPGVNGDVVSVLNLAESIECEQQLVTEQMVEQIVRSTDIESWWLTEDNFDTYRPANEGFQDGTMRLRAFAKTLPPATQMLTSRDPLGQIVPGVAGAEAVLVTGLGGGLGSGVALDLARRMEEAGTDVTLFGILPGDGFNDGARERANAHAALSELEYLALTEGNPFENIVLVPTPGDLSDIQSFDEAIAYAVLAHWNLPPNDRMALDETQAVGPDRYAPFTVALPQVLRFEVEAVDRALAETADWLHIRQHRLEVELDLYRELADLVVEAFPEHHDPVIAHLGDEPASPEEAPAEPMKNPFNLPVEEVAHLQRRVDTLLETLDGDLFGLLDNDVAFDWLHAIGQVRENAQANADGDDLQQVLSNMLGPLRQILLNDPVQGKPNDYLIGQDLDDTVRMELKAIIFRSRILRAAHWIDDAVYREGILNAVDEDRRFGNQNLRARTSELSQRIQDQRERMEAVDEIRHEVEKRCDHRIEVFLEESHDAIETLVLIARLRSRIEELLDHLEDLIRAFVAEVEGAAHQDELPDDPLDTDSLDELDGLLGELGIDSIDRERLLESASEVVEAKAAWLDWQGRLLPRVLSDWPERYERAFHRIDPELFDIPTPEEAEQEFYCDFVGSHTFERPRVTIETRLDQAIDDVVRAAERAVDTSDLNADDFPVSAENCPEIEWTDIDDRWRMELQDFLSSVSASHDPPSVGQVLDELCNPGGIVHEAAEEAHLAPVDRTLDTVQDDFEAIETDLDRTQRLGEIIEEQGWEFAMSAEDSQFPAPGTDLGPSQRADHYVRRESLGVEHLIHQPNSLAETDHPDVQAAIEKFLDTTVYPFQHLDDRVGLAAGDVVGNGNSGPVPYHGHRVIRAHFGAVFSDDGDDLPTDDALSEVADAVGGNENAASRYFGFGNPWELTAVTFVGGVFLDNLAPVTDVHGYRSAYGKLRNNLGEQIRVHHAHGLDGRDQSLVEPGDDAGFVYRDRVLNIHDHAPMGSIVAADEDEAVEWILKECVAMESFVGDLDTNPADDPGDPDRC